MGDTVNRKIKRIYVDTSVVGVIADDESRRLQTKPFWDAVQRGEITIIVSDVLVDELKGAPERVREFYRLLPESQVERIVSTDESNRLAERYIAEGVVGKSSLTDCRHIALATIAHADVLVSWNFKHIVNVDRIRGYNGINMKHGYPQIDIRTPSEVIHD
ncbi:MAG: PIN domain-containing protein [Planctomycetaceae bacterium]|jgi:predicted nucleic acid-binding protein|nr:PIN domain-containing protein [Planctomycetaceae bacterium]